MILEFQDYITGWHRQFDDRCKCPVVTFQVTDDCCLKCSYCYQINKGHRMMTKEIGKAGIDLLFKMYDKNDENAFINHHTAGLIIEFIGGEPFMNIDTISYISDYFMDQLIERNHPWLGNFRFSIASNGLLYFEEKVQQYIHKYQRFLALTISVDGPKELHDTCRVDHDGNGSFDQSIKAWDANKKLLGIADTKITFAPENLPYMNEIFNFFIARGAQMIYANPIYEHEWTIEEAHFYYTNLIKLADILLNTLTTTQTTITSSLFDETIGKPITLANDQNYCGGDGSMLAFDPDGVAYPCIRYMKSSLGTSCEPIIIGSVYNGLYKTPQEQEWYNKLHAVTRTTSSDNECINCHIAQGCGCCIAWNYQKNHDVCKRAKGICWMHRARTLANVYYWNKYYQLFHINKTFPMYLSRDIATKIILNEDYDKLLLISQI